jgi:hypothetical protein
MLEDRNDGRLDQHKLMMARLEDERTRRLKMEENRKELSQIRSSLVAENKKRKEDLESLDAQLQRFIEVSRSGSLAGQMLTCICHPECDANSECFPEILNKCCFKVIAYSTVLLL